MKKYKNIAQDIRIIILIFGLISIIVFFLGLNFIDDAVEFLALVLMLIVCNSLIIWMFFYLKELWYVTYIKEDEIVQHFFKNKKNISFKDIRYIYFIDNILIFSTEDQQIDYSSKPSIIEKKKIKKKLKNCVIITINLREKYFPLLISQKCKNVKKIKIGKINKYIENEFNI